MIPRLSILAAATVTPEALLFIRLQTQARHGIKCLTLRTTQISLLPGKVIKATRAGAGAKHVLALQLPLTIQTRSSSEASAMFRQQVMEALHGSRHTSILQTSMLQEV